MLLPAVEHEPPRFPLVSYSCAALVPAASLPFNPPSSVKFWAATVSMPVSVGLKSGAASGILLAPSVQVHSSTLSVGPMTEPRRIDQQWYVAFPFWIASARGG